MLGAAVTPAIEFNVAAGPDASRLILKFVMQYERDVGVIAAARAG
jgi:hypothetical protein